jgi:hypothetical protein
MITLTPMQLHSISERTGFTPAALKKFFKTQRGQAVLAARKLPTYADIYGARENPIEGAGFKVGERVQVHPAHDRFMMGDRYGNITAIKNVAGSSDPVRIRVKLDRSGQSVWFRPDYLMHVNPLSNKSMWLIGAGVLAAGAVAYYALKPAAAATTSATPLPPSTSPLHTLPPKSAQ